MKLSEVKGALTLEQLEQMDGQRVLVPETEAFFGGFGEVDVEDEMVENIVAVVDDEGVLGDWKFSDYGKTWIAVVDPFGVLEVEE